MTLSRHLGEPGRRIAVPLLFALVAVALRTWHLGWGLATSEWLPDELRNVSPQFTLNSDGSFTAVDLPEFRLVDDGSRRVGSVTWVNVARSGRGTWSILALDGHDKVSLRFEEKETFDAQFSISDWVSDGPGSPTTLYYFRGDPDSGQRIHFTRQR